MNRALADERRPRVLMVAGLAPVVVAGPDSFADEVILRAAATNVVHEGGSWPTVGFERLVELDPDVILDASVAEGGGVSLITPQLQGWKGLRAVRDGHVLPVSDERVLRAGPRIAEGIAVLAHALHPDVVVP